MKLKLFIIFTGLCLTEFHSYSQNFQYGFADVFSPNAQNYLVGENNMQMTSEGGNPADGVSYWNPVNNGQTASLTYEFTFAEPTTSISLLATIATYNFGGSEYGSGLLLASTDGENWVTLENAPTPAYPGYPYGASSTYNQILPNSLTGASEIWIQVQLNTSAYDIMSQFCRQDTSVNNGEGYLPDGNIFQINVDTVPEPSTTLFAACGLALFFMARMFKKSQQDFLI